MPDEIITPTPEQEQQERQSAEAAFAIAADDAPIKAAPAADAVKAVEAKPVPVKEVVDPWKDVPQVVREKLEGFDKLGNDMRSGMGRIAAMQSELAAAKAAVSKVDNAPTAEQIAAAAKSPEQWDKLKELFHDWSDEFSAADAIDERIGGRISEAIKLIPKAQEIDIAAIKNETRELSRVDTKHPTWEDDIYAPDGGFNPNFAAWKNSQPPEVQALGASKLSRDAIKMLDMYYDHRKVVATQEKNKQRLEAAIPAQGTSSQRQPTTSERDAAEKAFASA